MTEVVIRIKERRKPAENGKLPQETLAGAGVEFIVGGGVACVLHGVERVTLDLDVAVQMNSPNLDRLICAVEQLNLQPRVPVSLADIGDPDFVRSMVTEKGALVFSLADFNNPLRPSAVVPQSRDNGATSNPLPRERRKVAADAKEK